jgi:hypothetical protein
MRLLEVNWWELARGDDNLGRKVVETCQDIENRQVGIHEGNRRHARIYAGYLPQGLSWGVSPTASQRQPFEATKALVRSVCDTATALIVRTRPKATFVTDGADWDTQLAAEDLDQFMVGQYERGGLYQVAPRSFHDSTVFGTGGWKYVPRGSGEDFRVDYERVLVDDIIVDEDECREHLEPQTIYHRVTVRLDALIAKYCPGDSAKDRDLRFRLQGAAHGWPTRHVPKGRCVVVEAIHVDQDNPSKSRRVLACGGVALRDEVWPHAFQPYTFLWWSQPLTGFYGDGIAYRQYGRQQRITYLYRWIQRCHDLFATPRAWVDPAGGPPTMQLSNEIGQVIMTRKPPVFQTQQVCPPEVYQWLNQLEQGGYEDEGISQVTASNQLPPGLESAPAQREYSFKEGQRFAPVSQRWEHAVAVDTSRKTCALFRHNYQNTKKRPSVRWADRKIQHYIKWPDLDEEAYVIRPEASSLDALSPSARTQSALELAQTGWITPTEGRALVAHPDLRESDELGTAGETYAKMVLKQLRRGEVVVVDEYADLQALDRVVRQGRLIAIQRQAPADIVDGMARYLDEIDTLKQRAQEAMMMQQAAMAPAPGMAQTPTGPAAAPF